MLVAAARAGLGFVLVPEWLVGEEVRTRRLVEVLPDWLPEPATTPIYAVYPSGPYTPPKVRAFVDFVGERFSVRDAWSRPSRERR